MQQTVLQALLSVLQDNEKTQLQAEYDRWAHGPSAEEISEDPRLVQLFAEYKHALDGPAKPDSTDNIGYAQAQIGWVHSLGSAFAWSKVFSEAAHRIHEAERKAKAAKMKAEDDRIAAAARESLEEKDDGPTAA